MKPGERDLLILLNESDYTEAEIEREAMLINNMLLGVEADEKSVYAVEIMDFIHSRIIRKHRNVKKYFRKKTTPFIFYLHKN